MNTLHKLSYLSMAALFSLSASAMPPIFKALNHHQKLSAKNLRNEPQPVDQAVSIYSGGEASANSWSNVQYVSNVNTNSIITSGTNSWLLGAQYFSSFGLLNVLGFTSGNLQNLTTYDFGQKDNIAKIIDVVPGYQAEPALSHPPAIAWVTGVTVDLDYKLIYSNGGKYSPAVSLGKDLYPTLNPDISTVRLLSSRGQFWLIFRGSVDQKYSWYVDATDPNNPGVWLKKPLPMGDDWYPGDSNTVATDGKLFISVDVQSNDKPQAVTNIYEYTFGAKPVLTKVKSFSTTRDHPSKTGVYDGQFVLTTDNHHHLLGGYVEYLDNGKAEDFNVVGELEQTVYAANVASPTNWQKAPYDLADANDTMDLDGSICDNKRKLVAGKLSRDNSNYACISVKDVFGKSFPTISEQHYAFAVPSHTPATSEFVPLSLFGQLVMMQVNVDLKAQKASLVNFWRYIQGGAWVKTNMPVFLLNVDSDPFITDNLFTWIGKDSNGNSFMNQYNIKENKWSQISPADLQGKDLKFTKFGESAYHYSQGFENDEGMAPNNGYAMVGLTYDFSGR